MLDTARQRMCATAYNCKREEIRMSVEDASTAKPQEASFVSPKNIADIRFETASMLYVFAQ
jgi:hypothetical protein